MTKKEERGGLDIYAAEVFNNYISEVYHLEEPINSINDDFAYIINEETSTGFFSSNRLQGNENVDLYAFSLKKDIKTEDCFITVEGRVKDKDSQTLLKGANVELYDLKNELIQSISTENDGFYSFKVPCSQEYNLVGNFANYKEEKQRLEILENNYHKTLHSNLNMSRLEKNRIDESKDLSKILNLAPIYFDFDKVTIRTDAKSELDKIVKIMMENPTIIVEASAHTDSWGPASYNKILSERRAQSTVDYIIGKGIDPGRISGKGYGEERLLNNCEEPSQCSRSENQLNRRTEFVIANPGASIKLKIKKEIGTENSNSLAQKKSVKEILPEVKKNVIAVKNPYNNKLETSKPVVASVDPLKLNQESKKELEGLVENKKIEVAPKAVSPILKEKKEVKENKISGSQETVASITPIQPVTIKEPIKVAATAAKTPEKKVTETLVSAPKQEIKIKSSQGTVANIRPDQPITIIEPAKVSATTAVPAKKKIESAASSTKTVVVTSASAEPNKTNNKADIYINSQKIKVIENLSVLEEKYENAIQSYPEIASALTKEKLKATELKGEVTDNTGVGYSNIIAYNNEIISLNKTHQRLLENVNKKSPKVNDNIIILSESTNKSTAEEKAKSTVNAYMEEQKALTIVQLEEIEKKFRHTKNMKPKFTDKCMVQINKIVNFKETVKNNTAPEWANIIEYKKTVNEFNSIHKQILNEANNKNELSANKNNEDEIDNKSTVGNY
ncbi:MAG: OmpA family protein [Flavobacteriaceae bacterium]|nr:OmpA family protein [Flavobacteriaceae bacterium]